MFNTRTIPVDKKFLTPYYNHRLHSSFQQPSHRLAWLCGIELKQTEPNLFPKPEAAKTLLSFSKKLTTRLFWPRNPIPLIFVSFSWFCDNRFSFLLQQMPFGLCFCISECVHVCIPLKCSEIFIYVSNICLKVIAERYSTLNIPNIFYKSRALLYWTISPVGLHPHDNTFVSKK